MEICNKSHWTDLSNSCVRDSLAAVAPALLVAGVLIASIPQLRRTLSKLGRPFADFLSYSEAEALLSEPHHSTHEEDQRASPWSPIFLCAVSLAISLVWLTLGCYRLVMDSGLWSGTRDILVSSTWLYAALRPLIWPFFSVPFDLFSLFTLHMLFSIIVGFGYVYDDYVYATPFPSTLETALFMGNAVAVAVLLAVVLNMRLTTSSEIKDYGVDGTPEDHTNLWGWMSFDWVTPLLRKAVANTTLTQSDVYSISPIMQARPLFIKFSRLRGGLLGRVWRANSRDMILDVGLTYVSIVLSYAGPFFLKHILDALDDTRGDQGPEARAIAYVYAIAAFSCTLLGAQIDLQHLYFGRRAAIRVRTELMVAIYDKALKRKTLSGAASNGHGQNNNLPAKSEASPSSANSGKVLNLMSADVSSVSNTVSTAHIIYGAPFQIVIATLFLYEILGWAAFAGFIVVLLTLPLNNMMAKRTSAIAKRTSAARDSRMGVLNELITAIKFIKFFAWEDKWVERVLSARTVELHWITKERVNSILFSLLGYISPVLVSAASFYVYIAQGNELSIGTAFTALALYSKVRQPFNTVNTFFSQLLRSKVALDRIATYLDEDEIDGQVSNLQRNPVDEEDPGLAIVDGSFRWNSIGTDTSNAGESVAAPIFNTSASSAHHDFELKNINIVFPEDRLTLVTGPTAGGKTALLMALLGEMTTLHGRVFTSKNSSKIDDRGLLRSISYAAQTPWLRHQSIRENVLFGFPYNDDRYRAVIECCALIPDLEMLEDGDATEIGTRGVTLSGGQKARVALARAIYAPTKYVLLDDPLSAVDSHTARFLVERLLRGPLLAGRTVILVTHHVDLVLPSAHYLLRMVNGRIETQGTVEDLRVRGILGTVAALEERELAAGSRERLVASEVGTVPGGKPIDVEKTTLKKPRVLVEEERRAVGRIKWPTYKAYLEASSYWTWVILGILVFVSQFVGVGEKVWIKIWGEAYRMGGSLPAMQLSAMYWGSTKGQKALPASARSVAQVLLTPTGDQSTRWANMTFPPAEEHPYFYIGIYTAIALSAGLISVCAAIAQYAGGLRASRLMFEQLLNNVVRATMRWYDTTPQGRLLNRFSKDIETIDTSLGQTLRSISESLASLVVSLVIITVIFPLFVVPATILTYFYILIASLYQPAGRDIRRMESTSKSPIFSSLSEVLDGIVTIRAFSVEARFLDDFFKKVDAATQMFHMFWQVNRWLQLQLQVVNAIMVLTTTLFALSGYVSAGLAGICITSAISFTGDVYWVCRNWANLELEFNSVERIVEYLDLPKEPPTHISKSRPPAYWPSSTSTNGDSLLVVRDLVVKYAPELPPVLHGVSFSLRARERVGLIGRTGSGKSTLAMSLLRFVEPASGSIIIDGIDISSVGLHDLRSRVTFIPQDATLFSGTLRENLDPFNEHTDAECLDVLYRVHLLSDARATPNPRDSHPEITGGDDTRGDAEAKLEEATRTITLDAEVSAGGTNFSQGQRQLIAMARALLRHSALVILDEATSSIDMETDAKIQATIREEFKESMLLTVAHRLRTIVDYDRLLVLDKGKVVEFDTPLNLIHREGGIFRSLCAESGTLEELEKAARAKTDRDSLVGRS
ncbi:P-loop containing nucleoside triphosphate hydrolase protein [Dichomitus squalens]|nr:P-loop containing nucleoside triphosphate hydrolase protein [Dichomitus squalens]